MTATEDDLTGLLERDYRRLLRWYPRRWRDAHGDAMLGILMDDAEASDRFLVRRGEWRDFTSAGLTARLDRIIARPVRDATATVMLSMGTGASLIVLLMTSWAPWGTRLPDAPGFGPFYDAGPILTVLWVIAFIAALAGRWQWGRIALLLSIVAAIAMRPVEIAAAPPHFFSLNPAVLTYSVTCALLAIIGTPRAGLRMIGATAGWATSTWTGYAIQSALGDLQGDQLLNAWYTRPDWPTSIVLIALVLAVLIAVLRLWTPAFTTLLTALPLLASADAAAFVLERGSDWILPDPVSLLIWPLNVSFGLGVAALVMSSHGGLTLPVRHGTEGARPSPPCLMPRATAMDSSRPGRGVASRRIGIDQARRLPTGFALPERGRRRRGSR